MGNLGPGNGNPTPGKHDKRGRKTDGEKKCPSLKTWWPSYRYKSWWGEEIILDHFAMREKFARRKK